MLHQFCRIFVNSVRAGLYEFIHTVSASEKPNSQSVCTPRGQQVPDAVADYDAVLDVGIQAFGSGEKEIGEGLTVGDISACDEMRV